MLKRPEQSEEMSEGDLIAAGIAGKQIPKPRVVSNPRSVPDLGHWLPSHRHLLFSDDVSGHQLPVNNRMAHIH